MKDHEIERFAKHYAISLWVAREVCLAAGSWAGAFDLLVIRITTTENAQ